MKTKLTASIAAGAAIFAAAAFADALPGRIEYAINLGTATAKAGRFLPVGSAYWQEGKAWNKEYAGGGATAAAGYAGAADIYNTYIYPNDTTEGVSATYILPGLEANAAYTLRLHVLEVFFDIGYADHRKFDVAVNGETKVSSLEILELAGAKLKGAYADIPVTADSGGKLAISFVNVANQFNVAALEVFSSAPGLPVPSPKVRREARGVNVLTIETRNAAYLYDIEYRTGDGGTAYTLKSGVSGLRVVHTSGKATTQYRVRAVLDGAHGDWSAWTPVDTSLRASDESLYIACADPGQAAPDGWVKDESFRVFPSDVDHSYVSRWNDYDLTWFPEDVRPPLLIFQLAVVQASKSLSYRFTGLDPARNYRVRIHQMEPNASYLATYRYFAYHFNNSLDRATDTNGNTTVDPYIVAGNVAIKAAAVDYEIVPDSAGTILVTAENINNFPNFFGLELHPLGTVVDPPPPGLSIIIR